jgi:hypothetical protein
MRVFICLMVMYCFAAVNAVVASSPDSVTARVTEAQGLVKKRDYIDWKKEMWGPPSDVRVGDELSEGMQIGTGADSWAEVTWPDVTARAWANSSYAVAPNRKLVYLSNGEMLFQLDKHRKDKTDYCIWTNLMQARIRGTTVLVQSDGETSKISVLEGTIDVLNRIEHSVIRLKPGVVYQIHSLDPSTRLIKQSWVLPNQPRQQIGNLEKSETQTNETAAGDLHHPIALATAGNTGENLTPAGSTRENLAPGLTNIVNEKIAPLSIFDTAKTASSISLIDPKSVLNQVFSSGFKNALPSASLVQQSLGSVIALGDSSVQATKLLKNNVIPLRVPVESSYRVGQIFSSILPLPETALTHWSPSGWIAETAAAPGVTNLLVAAQPPAERAVFHASRVVKALPILNLATFNAGLPGGTSLPGATPLGNGNFLVNNNIIVTNSASVLPASFAPALVASGGNTAFLNSTISTVSTGNTIINGATSATIGHTTGALIGSTGTLVAGTGALGGAGGLVGGVGGLLGGTGGLLGGAGGLLGGAGGLLGSTLGSTTQIVTGLANGTLTQVVTLVNGLPAVTTIVNSPVNTVLHSLGTTLGSLPAVPSLPVVGNPAAGTGLLGALSLKTTSSPATSHTGALGLGSLLKH